MRMKRMVTVILAIALSITCCACSQKLETPTEAAENMRAALAKNPCGQAQAIVNIELTLNGGEQDTVALSTTTTTDMTISQEPVSGYAVATVDVDYDGEKSQSVTENYTVVEDGEAVAYIKSSGIWIRMSTGQTPEDYADSVSSVALDGSNVAIDKTVTELNGKAVICLTTQLTGQNMRPVLSGVLNNFGSAFADSSAIAGADYSSVICDSRIYLDKETYLPISYEVNFTGMNDVLNALLADTGMTADVASCTSSVSFLSYEKQQETVLPGGAKEKAEAWSRLMAGEPDNGDGTFTIREGTGIVDIVPPAGFELAEKDYDHLYFKRDDNREVKYTVYYGWGSADFIAQMDRRLERYGNLPRDLSREQMTLEGDTLDFEADIAGVTWESYEEGCMNAWAVIGNDGTADYCILVEVTDGYNDGLGGVKSADVTPDEFMAYLNAVTVSGLISE